MVFIFRLDTNIDTTNLQTFIKSFHSFSFLLKEFPRNCHYSGTSNRGHFPGPSLMAVALGVTDVGRFYYMHIFY